MTILFLNMKIYDKSGKKVGLEIYSVYLYYLIFKFSINIFQLISK